MSLTTTIILVMAAIFLYYVVMICYDVYVERMSMNEAEAVNEEPIDVSDQLQDFESYDISKQDDESTTKRRAFVSWICKGLSAEKMNRLMEDAASGTPNAELKNILFKCNQLAGGPV